MYEKLVFFGVVSVLFAPGGVGLGDEALLVLKGHLRPGRAGGAHVFELHLNLHITYII